MTFTLIELGNDAMQSARNLSEALQGVAYRILCDADDTRRPITKVDGRKILDANGNSVGQWSVE